MTNLFLFYQWLMNLTGLVYAAASSLPLIIVLGLAAGRRGNGSFCLQSNLYLLKWEIWLALIAVVYFPILFICQIFPVPDLLANWPVVGMSLAGRPYLTSLIVWMSGLPPLLLAAFLLKKNPPGIVDNRYQLKTIRWPVFLCLFAACCFFCTYALSNWPFAGWPAGLTMERTVMAIARNAFRHYFAAFCPAGATALLIAGYVFWREPPKSADHATLAAISMRWLSVWAVIGYLPHVINGWGLTLGLGLRGMPGASFISRFYGQIAELALLSIAIILWLCILLNRHAISSEGAHAGRDWERFIKRDNILAWTAFALLLIKTGTFVATEVLKKLF